MDKVMDHKGFRFQGQMMSRRQIVDYMISQGAKVVGSSSLSRTLDLENGQCLTEKQIGKRAMDYAKIEEIRRERAKCDSPVSRILFDNDPSNGSTAERIVAMSGSLF